jgi:hypothetical protein
MQYEREIAARSFVQFGSLQKYGKQRQTMLWPKKQIVNGTVCLLLTDISL